MNATTAIREFVAGEYDVVQSALVAAERHAVKRFFDGGNRLVVGLAQLVDAANGLARGWLLEESIFSHRMSARSGADFAELATMLSVAA